VNPHVQQILSENKTSDGNSTDDLLWWIPVTFFPKPSRTMGLEDCSALRQDSSKVGGVDYTDVWIPGTQRNISVDFSRPSYLMVNPTATGNFQLIYNAMKIFTVYSSFFRLLQSSLRSRTSRKDQCSTIFQASRFWNSCTLGRLFLLSICQYG